MAKNDPRLLGGVLENDLGRFLHWTGVLSGPRLTAADRQSESREPQARPSNQSWRHSHGPQHSSESL